MKFYEKINAQRSWAEKFFKNATVVGENSHLIAHINLSDEWLDVRLRSEGLKQVSTFLGNSSDLQSQLYDILANDMFIDLVCEEIVKKNDKKRLSLTDKKTTLKVYVDVDKVDWEDMTGTVFPNGKKRYWKNKEIKETTKLNTVRFCFNYNSNAERIYLTTVYPN